MPLGKVHVRIMLADNLNMSNNANWKQFLCIVECVQGVHGETCRYSREKGVVEEYYLNFLTGTFSFEDLSGNDESRGLVPETSGLRISYFSIVLRDVITESGSFLQPVERVFG